MRACSAVDAVGFNCVCGARHMLELARGLEHSGVTPGPDAQCRLSRCGKQPHLYDGDPAYFAAQIAEMAGGGAAILGGCCGTTPAHIAQCAKALSQRGGAGPAAVEQKPRAGQPEPQESRFWTKLQRGGAGLCRGAGSPPPTPAWTSSWPGRRSSGGAGRTS